MVRRRLVEQRQRNVKKQKMRECNSKIRKLKLIQSNAPINENEMLKNYLASIKESAGFLYSSIDENSMNFLIDNITKSNFDVLLNNENKELLPGMNITIDLKHDTEDFKIYDVIVPGARIDKDFFINVSLYQKRSKLNGFRSGKMDLALVHCQYAAKIDETINQQYRQEVEKEVLSYEGNGSFVCSFSFFQKNKSSWNFACIAHKSTVNAEEVMKEFLSKNNNDKEEPKKNNGKEEQKEENCSVEQDHVHDEKCKHD